MAPKEHIETILRTGVQAPSGDNAQPWRFEVRSDVIDLYLVPGKDYSPYNFRERGSFFANGAVIENVVVAASGRGYAAKVALFPTGDKTHVARITLSAGKGPADSLAVHIERRATNRKPYQSGPLSSEHKEALLAAARGMAGGTLTLVEDPKAVARFAKVVSLSDRLIFEEKMIHDAIFYAIRWTEQEEEERKGLYVKTMELPPPARALFRMLRSWPVLRVMNVIGISRFIAMQSAKGYAASSAIGMVTIPNDANTNFVEAGRLFERLWLTATKLGVSIQPVTALAYLDQKFIAGEADDLTPDHGMQVHIAQKVIAGLFGNPAGTVAMMFRMGYGDAPSARSKKAEPAITYSP